MRSLILFILLIFNVRAYALYKGVLTPYNPKSNTFYEGDIFKGKLLLSPVSFEMIKDFKTIEGKEIFSGIKLVSISEIQPIKDKKETFELDGYFLVLDNMKRVSHQLKINKFIFTVELKNLKFKNTDVLTKEIVIYRQVIPFVFSNMIIGLLIAIVIILFCILLYYEKKRRKAVNNIKNKNKHIDNWKEILKNADDRQKFEEIYSKRSEWKFFFVKDDYDLFVKTINNYQFKNCWSERELEEVKLSVNNILTSLRMSNDI